MYKKQSLFALMNLYYKFYTPKMSFAIMPGLEIVVLHFFFFNFYTEYIMLDWINHKLESRLLGEILINSDMQMIPL